MASSTERLRAESVLHQLKECGITHVVWLPDSETGFMYRALIASDLTLIPVCREGESMAIAAGLIMGGKRPVVLIQSTGFFESGDCVRGFCKDLKLPLLLLLGYRGYPGEGQRPRDSAAAILEPLLKVWDIPYEIVTSDATCGRIAAAYRRAQGGPHTEAVLIGKEYA